MTGEACGSGNCCLPRMSALLVLSALDILGTQVGHSGGLTQ